jgi:hypothetical protein
MWLTCTRHGKSNHHAQHQTGRKSLESQDANHVRVHGLQTDLFGRISLHPSPRRCPHHSACLCRRYDLRIDVFASNQAKVFEIKVENIRINSKHQIMSVLLLSMVIALSMSRACQPHSGALLLCMVVSDSIHRTCKSDVSAL